MLPPWAPVRPPTPAAQLTRWLHAPLGKVTAVVAATLVLGAGAGVAAASGAFTASSPRAVPGTTVGHNQGVNIAGYGPVADAPQPSPSPSPSPVAASSPVATQAPRVPAPKAVAPPKPAATMPVAPADSPSLSSMSRPATPDQFSGLGFGCTPPGPVSPGQSLVVVCVIESDNGFSGTLSTQCGLAGAGVPLSDMPPLPIPGTGIPADSSGYLTCSSPDLRLAAGQSEELPLTIAISPAAPQYDWSKAVYVVLTSGGRDLDPNLYNLPVVAPLHPIHLSLSCSEVERVTDPDQFNGMSIAFSSSTVQSCSVGATDALSEVATSLNVATVTPPQGVQWYGASGCLGLTQADVEPVTPTANGSCRSTAGFTITPTPAGATFWFSFPLYPTHGQTWQITFEAVQGCGSNDRFEFPPVSFVT